jgi:protein SCO1/2
MPRWVMPLILVLLAVFLASLGSVFMLLHRQRDGVVVESQSRSDDPAKPDPFVDGLSIPAFSLVDQTGAPVTNEVFKGHVTIVDFIFTRCIFICPTMTATMSGLAGRLDGPRVQFLSFSVDPEHDTSQQLAEYAKDHDADPARWKFLTGSKATIWGILRTGLKWGIEEDDQAKIPLGQGATMNNIRHPGWFALIGPDGQVLGVYPSSDDDAMEQLAQRARRVAAGLNAKR